EGDPRDAEGLSFHSMDHERLVSRGPAGLLPNDRLVDAGALDGDRFHFGPTAGVPSFGPHGRAGGQQHGVAVLGGVNRLPYGLRRQGGSLAGFGTNPLGR